MLLPPEMLKAMDSGDVKLVELPVSRQSDQADDQTPKPTVQVKLADFLWLFVPKLTCGQDMRG